MTQVGELMGLAERLNRRIAECHLVAFGKPEDIFRLDCPFYI
jgi:hypothetical protein